MLENGSLRNCSGLAGRGGAFAFPLPQRGEEEAAAADPRPRWVVTVLSSVLIFTTVVDVVGSLLVVVSVFKNRKLRNAGNAFVVSLALADLVVAVYPYPLVLVALFHNGWSLGETHCKASGFVMGLSVIGSIFNITAIAINRYCYICHSFVYNKVYSWRNTIFYVCLVWVLTVVAIVPNFFIGSLKYDQRIYSCTFAQTTSSCYTIAVVVIHFILPITIVSFCYLRIWILVIRVRRKVKSELKLKIKPSDFRNFLTMFVVFVIFAFCWAPLNLIGLAVAINPSEVAPKIPEWLFVVSYFMAYFNSCLNAIIYGLLNQNFRKEYKRILMSLWLPTLFHHNPSKEGDRNIKSKLSPVLNDNDQIHTRTL
ncbi:LOW QUALITY PROTEIN: melatonin receptor type 1B [Pituophis catenifer annectens]|uniref:LOW QUALITY PROTEIN: melatonin receptor type 1B n=1 Tax=Pituophis catenifer annectens TaxID=94852 RepID=UPI003990E308